MALLEFRTPFMQKVYELLVADTDLSAAVGGRIYDNVPHETPYPYVEIGDLDSECEPTHTNERQAGQLEIHVWSNYKGTKEANQIIDLINKVLDNVDLDLDCFTTIEFRCSLAKASKDPDGTTIKGLIRYDFILGG